ncbi:MAG: glycosyltransferase family 39 protein [Candidatus Erginobacter occultus]|nr:glycosyltransferase family 39 protein [Candidatus Erginobacter occultus]
MKIKSKYLYGIAVFLVLVAAFLLRRNFFLNHHQAPVVWDAAGYNIQAKEFAAAFSAWPDREAFLEHFKKAYEMALPKCELYPLFVSLVYLARGIDFSAVRIAQGFLGTLSLLLLYLIAVGVGNRRVGLISILIGAFYIPFIISEGRLLTETAAISVFLLTVWLLVLSLKRGAWWLVLLAGFSTALMVITRTFFQYVYILYFPMLIVGLAARKKQLRARSSAPGEGGSPVLLLLRLIPWNSLFFILGLAVIIVPRLFWTPQVDRHGRSFISGSWRNGLAMYCGVYPPVRGLQTSADPGGEILRSIPAGRHPGAADERYLKAYIQILIRQPRQALEVILAKGWLFYRRAYNDFLQGYLFSPSGINIFHRILLLAGLFGLALLPIRGLKSWPVIISLVYGWGMTFAADAEARYALTQMPLMILAGVFFGEQLVFGVSDRIRKRQWSGLIFFALAAAVLGALSLIAQPRFALMFLPGLTFPAAWRLRMVIVSLFFLSLVPLLYRIYRGRAAGWKRPAGAVIPPVLLLLFYLSAVKVHPWGRQWSTRLTGRDQVVRQTISLPEDITRYRSGDLKLDLVSGPVRRYDLTVSVDGEVVRKFQDGLTPDPASWVPAIRQRAFPVYLRETGRKMADVRQWYTVPLDLDRLAGRSEVEVEIRFTPRFNDPGCWIDLYGDYRYFPDPAVFEGPTLPKDPGRLSLYKYLVDDDWRVWEKTRVLPVRTAEYLGPGKSRPDDLSTASGIQSGTFRIFGQFSERTPPPSDFPVAVRGQEYLTERSILADYYNLQIWEVNPWKRRGDRMVLEAAHAAPGEAGGFQLVVYADTDRDGKPDLLVEQSPYHTADKQGEWSSFTFTTDQKHIFVGMAWPRGSKTTVYYERLLWPDDLFPERMYYRTGPGAATAHPVLTNMRLSFLDD